MSVKIKSAITDVACQRYICGLETSTAKGWLEPMKLAEALDTYYANHYIGGKPMQPSSVMAPNNSWQENKQDGTRDTGTHSNGGNYKKAQESQSSGGQTAQGGITSRHLVLLQLTVPGADAAPKRKIHKTHVYAGTVNHHFT